ncbi:MAG: pantoate--beta-alanine ligase [Chitinispirillaceae bacterium]|nr:pantoate--beta-alanine ligase [Chitinispirillaceae bacterium]
MKLQQRKGFPVRIIKTVSEMSKLSATYRKNGKIISFVPTMGALHEGHLSLLKIAKKNGDVSIMSIFVNPTQFGPNEDYHKYPRPFESDCKKAEEGGCDVIFAPFVDEMYPTGYCTTVSVKGITEKLCGISRPGHFNGVTTVVMKLFNIVQPDVAIFGAKDAQQVIVIKRMVTDLNCPVKIIVGQTVREADGLALSSRNIYLTPEERKAAPLIYSGLCKAETLFKSGIKNAEKLKGAVEETLAQSNLIEPEYIEIVDKTTLESLPEIISEALLAVACRMKLTKTRLIDNIVLGGSL